MNQNAVRIISVAIFAQSFNVKVIRFALLPAHPQAGNFHWLICVILECDRLSLCKAGCEFIGKCKVTIFENIDRMIVIDGEPSAIILVLPLPVEQ
jgi:hypothetical protein